MTNPVQSIILDLDDTLIENSSSYINAAEAFSVFMSGLGFSKPEVTREAARQDRKTINSHRYGKIHFTGALVNTYKSLCAKHKKKHSPAVCRQIREAVDKEFSNPAEIYSGVFDTLYYLKGRGCRVFIMTLGDKREQEAKIIKCGFDTLVEGWHVAKRKDASAYSAFVKKNRLDPCNTFMAGNSYKYDILPAKKAGLKTILVYHESTWEYEKLSGEVLKNGTLFVKNIKELMVHF